MQFLQLLLELVHWCAGGIETAWIPILDRYTQTARSPPKNIITFLVLQFEKFSEKHIGIIPCVSS